MFAAELTEAEASLRVSLAAGGLALLGVALLALTIWWWRNTRPEPPALGPLEVMSERRWAKSRDTDRSRLIDGHRPHGAFALDGRRAAPEPIDLSVLARNLPSGFDDLKEPVPVPVVAEPDSVAPSRASAPVADGRRNQFGDVRDIGSGDRGRSLVEERVLEERVLEERVLDDRVLDDRVVRIDDSDENTVIDPLLQRAASSD